MSSYEAYDETSRNYDRTRVPIGSEIILGCLARQARPLDTLTVLDAGCGTGAYSEAIVDRVGRVEALDMSQGMLDAAAAKLADAVARDRIGFHQGAITELPFGEASFDAVMINQVLHHLDDDAGAEYALHRRVIGEFARVLRSGGALIVNSSGQEQLEAYWYYHLVPELGAAMRRRFAPLDALRRILTDTGFDYVGSFVPADQVCQGDAFFDGHGPLDKAWRDGDSMWALASGDQIEAACARVRELDASGALDHFVAAYDDRRRTIGQITFLYAIKR